MRDAVIIYVNSFLMHDMRVMIRVERKRCLPTRGALSERGAPCECVPCKRLSKSAAAAASASTIAVSPTANLVTGMYVTGDRVHPKILFSVCNSPASPHPRCDEMRSHSVHYSQPSLHSDPLYKRVTDTHHPPRSPSQTTTRRCARPALPRTPAP